MKETAVGSCSLHTIRKRSEIMKKLLASALLAGLMLGTTTQVFAATGETTQNIPISSEIIATYQVLFQQSHLSNLQIP